MTLLPGSSNPGAKLVWMWISTIGVCLRDEQSACGDSSRSLETHTSRSCREAFHPRRSRVHSTEWTVGIQPDPSGRFLIFPPREFSSSEFIELIVVAVVLGRRDPDDFILQTDPKTL